MHQEWCHAHSPRRDYSIAHTAAKDYLIAKGYDPIYGARPLKRLLQTEVETLLARWIIAEDPAPDTHITVDYDGTKLTAKRE